MNAVTFLKITVMLRTLRLIAWLMTDAMVVWVPDLLNKLPPALLLFPGLCKRICWHLVEESCNVLFVLDELYGLLCPGLSVGLLQLKVLLSLLLFPQAQLLLFGFLFFLPYHLLTQQLLLFYTHSIDEFFGFLG